MKTEIITPTSDNPKLLAKLGSYAKAVMKNCNEHTAKAFKQDTLCYEAFCREHNLSGFPCTGEQMAQYIKWLAYVKEYKFTTIERRINNLTKIHREMKLENPKFDGWDVRMLMENLAKTSEPPQQARPLRHDDMENIMLAIDGEDCELTKARDKAIIVLAYDSMLRRSELAQLQLSHFEQTEDGDYNVRCDRIKLKGGKVGNIRFCSAETYARVEHMVYLCGLLDDGRIFHRLRNGKSMGPLSDSGIGYVFSKYGFSGHSARVGAAIDQRAAGLSGMEIAQSGGWKSDAMPMHYSKAIDVKESGSAKLARMRREAV